MNYTFIFFNNSAAANAYDLFKNAFLLLTLEQLERLKNFVIVRPSFYHKAMDYFCFGTLHKYFYSRQLSFDNCEQLCAKYNIPISDFVDFVPKYIARQ